MTAPRSRTGGPAARRPEPTAITLCSATLGEDDICEPPLGPLYIAAALEEAEVAVDFRDFQLDPIVIRVRF